MDTATPAARTKLDGRIRFTDSAAAKVAELMAAEANPDLRLRIFVRGGGCSGFHYGFEFDETVAADDLTVSRNGMSLVIDAMSYQRLIGAEIDYTEEAQFVIDNPNDTHICDCGRGLPAEA